MIADMLCNKKVNPIVIQLFMRDRKINISLVFTTQFDIALPKSIVLNYMHYFIMKVPNNSEVQESVF